MITIPTEPIGSIPRPLELLEAVAASGAGDPALDPLYAAALKDTMEQFEATGSPVITDGEQRRESYSNRLATALAGVDIDNPGTTINRSGRPIPVPRVAGPIRRTRAVEVRDVEFLRRNTTRRIKITLPGPFTMTQQAQDDHYGDEEAVAMAFAAAVNEEIRDLKTAGADVIQLDEPWLQARHERAARSGVKAINRALEGIAGTTVVHLCFGYAAAVKDKPSGYSFLPQLADTPATQISIEAAQPRLDLGVLRDLAPKTVMLGVIDLGDPKVESAETVAARIRAGLAHVGVGRLVAAPECGMKYLSREVAYGKLRALAEGAALVRRQFL